MIFYTDKPETFECNVNVEGASLDSTKARLVFESKKWNLCFYGDIGAGGKCKIEIGKLNILSEGETGKIRLEIIAEDTYFVPWNGNFEIQTNKKVTVEVMTPEKKPLTESSKSKISVSVVPVIKEMKLSGDKKECFNEAIRKIKGSNINSDNLNKNRELVKKIITETIRSHNIINDKNSTQWVIDSTIDFLGKRF
jgi:hypothetical protein